MPPSSVAARSLALAVIGVGAASFAAHGQNVTAFNPYSGVGLPDRPVSQYGSQTASPTVATGAPAPATGPAFNPWSSRGRASAAGQANASPAGAAPEMVMASPGQAYDPGASLPPPPGSIRSRIVAIPELTTSRSGPHDVQKASTVQLVPAPARAPVANPVPKPETPPVAAPARASAPPPAPVARPAALPPVEAAPKAAPLSQMAAAAPPPSPPPARPAHTVVAITVAFTARSTELSDASKAELDRLARQITERTLRQVELRTIADNGNPDSRKISLARALIVRNYLIDKGVRSKIEIASIVGDGGERVEILVPST